MKFAENFMYYNFKAVYNLVSTFFMYRDQHWLQKSNTKLAFSKTGISDQIWSAASVSVVYGTFLCKCWCECWKINLVKATVYSFINLNYVYYFSGMV